MAENISKLTLNGSVYDIKDNATEFKTINGQSIKGEGNIEIENDTDLTNYYTKEEIDNMVGDINNALNQI